MTDRVRLGPPPRRTNGAFASWLVGILVAGVLVRAMTNDSLPAAGGFVGLLLLAAWAALWWRFRCRGVYVSTSRVWVSRVFGTQSFELASVDVVDTMPSRPDGVRQLVLHLEDGRKVAAPLRGYARGKDDGAGPLDVLSSSTFDHLLTDLQRRAMSAVPEGE